MTSILEKRWLQDLLVYGGIGLVVLLVIYTIAKGLVNASDPVTAGEVHWHADIAYEACGQTVSFDDEKGHTITHGHNDDQVHVEGIILDEQDISLASFFKNSGINITSENFEDYNNGDLCDSSTEPGKVSFYVDGELFSDPNEIIIADKQNIRVVFE